jgi:hypothetical protein
MLFPTDACSSPVKKSQKKQQKGLEWGDIEKGAAWGRIWHGKKNLLS